MNRNTQTSCNLSIETSHSTVNLKQGPQPSLQGSAWTAGFSVTARMCERIDLNKESEALMTFAQGQYKDWGLKAFSNFPSRITAGILHAVHMTECVFVCVRVCRCLTWPSVGVQHSVSRWAHDLAAVQGLWFNFKREIEKRDMLSAFKLLYETSQNLMKFSSQKETPRFQN